MYEDRESGSKFKRGWSSNGRGIGLVRKKSRKVTPSMALSRGCGHAVGDAVRKDSKVSYGRVALWDRKGARRLPKRALRKPT